MERLSFITILLLFTSKLTNGGMPMESQFLPQSQQSPRQSRNQTLNQTPPVYGRDTYREDTPPPPAISTVYLGCHKDSLDVRLLSDLETKFQDTLTVELCVNHCKTSEFRYAGVQYSEECFCSDTRPTYKTLTDEEDCNKPCAGNSSQHCGGQFRLNVYDTKVESKNAVAENYLGCYIDSQEVVTLNGYKGWSSLLIPELCLGSCYRRGFHFAGLEYGRECFCGDSPSSGKKVKNSHCAVDCAGDSNFKCGGNWRLSIYHTGISDNILDEDNYLGCYRDDENEKLRLLSALEMTFWTTNSPRKCMNFCLSEGYKYSGTQYGIECYCGNLKPPTENKVSEMRCRTACSGDTSSYCGGDWTLNVYDTGKGRVKPIYPELTESNKTSASGIISTSPTPILCTPSQTTYKGKTACQGELIFEENFDRIDRKKWMQSIYMPWIPDYAFVMYTDKSHHTYVKDGKLFIKPNVLDETTVLRGNLVLPKCTGSQYTEECERQSSSFNIIPPIESGELKTVNSFSFKYGIVKIRAKFPAGDWIVPSLWLEPSKTKYGRGAENGRISLGMARGNRKLTSDGKDIGASHLEYGVRMGVGEKIKFKHLFKDKSQAWYLQFHDYTLTWTPSSLTFKIDNEPEEVLGPTVGTSLCDLMDFSRDECKKWIYGSSIAPFDEEFHIAIGVYVGGMRDFPDESMSGSKAKPWKNWGVKAMVNFWKAKDEWLPTWRGDESALQVESITVNAL